MKLLPRREPTTDVLFLNVLADGMKEPEATRLREVAQRLEKLETDRAAAIRECETWKRRMLRFSRHDASCKPNDCRCGLSLLYDELIVKYTEQRDQETVR